MRPFRQFMAELVVMFVAFSVVGGVLGYFLTYGTEPEDPAAPSRLATVVGVWAVDGGELCRAFSYRDLLPSLDTLSVRFDLSPADVATCQGAFSAYDRRQGWPRKVRADEARYEGYAFEVVGSEPLEMAVRRATDDPAVWAETRYRVDPTGAIVDLRTNSATAGQGLGPLLGAMLGMITWFFWAAILLLRRLANMGKGA